MRSQFLKVSALALASALYIPFTLGQEAEAEVEAPPPLPRRKSLLKILTSYLSWWSEVRHELHLKTKRANSVLLATRPTKLRR